MQALSPSEVVLISPWTRSISVLTFLCLPRNSVVKLTDSFILQGNYHPSIGDCLVGSHFTLSDTRYMCGEGSKLLVSAYSPLPEF